MDGVLPVVVGAAAVLATLATIAQVVLQVRNPFEPKPKPHLTLRPVDGDETTSYVVGPELRSVDIDAVVANARAAALAVKPSSVGLAMGKFAEPTEADHEKYKVDVESYAEEVREWAEAAQEWIRERATLLEGEVIQHNPASLVADDADIFVTFPAGTEEEVEDERDPPTAPEPPAFPLTLTPAGRMMMGHGSFGADNWRMRGGVSLMDTGVRERLAVLEKEASFWRPFYERERDGTLTLSYNRQAIRHGQSVPSGDPFRVRLPAGEHEVRWRVHARNLPHHVEGAWAVSCSAEPSGAPIDNVYDLEAVLRGEPIREFDLSSLFGKQDAES